MSSLQSQTNLSDNLLHVEVRIDQESSNETSEEDAVGGEEESTPHRITIDPQLYKALIEGDVGYVTSLKPQGQIRDRSAPKQIVM